MSTVSSSCQKTCLGHRHCGLCHRRKRIRAPNFSREDVYAYRLSGRMEIPILADSSHSDRKMPYNLRYPCF
jgi:hypothetical protein